MIKFCDRIPSVAKGFWMNELKEIFLTDLKVDGAYWCRLLFHADDRQKMLS